MANLGQTTVNCDVLRVTENAVFMEIPEGKFWVPKSVCLDRDSIEVGDTDLCIANWWLEKEGICH